MLQLEALPPHDREIEIDMPEAYMVPVVLLMVLTMIYKPAISRYQFSIKVRASLHLHNYHINLHSYLIHYATIQPHCYRRLHARLSSSRFPNLHSSRPRLCGQRSRSKSQHYPVTRSRLTSTPPERIFGRTRRVRLRWRYEQVCCFSQYRRSYRSRWWRSLQGRRVHGWNGARRA